MPLSLPRRLPRRMRPPSPLAGRLATQSLLYALGQVTSAPSTEGVGPTTAPLRDA